MNISTSIYKLFISLSINKFFLSILFYYNQYFDEKKYFTLFDDSQILFNASNVFIEYILIDFNFLRDIFTNKKLII